MNLKSPVWRMVPATVRMEGDGINDGVRHPDGLEAKGADLERVPGAHRHEVEFRTGEAVFCESESRKLDGVSRSKDRHIIFGQQVRQSPDVILVAVGEDNGTKTVRALRQVVKTGVVDVNPEVGGRERHATVDQNEGVACSNTSAFIPISPSPPSGTIRSVEAEGDLSGDEGIDGRGRVNGASKRSNQSVNVACFRRSRSIARGKGGSRIVATVRVWEF